MRKLLLVISSVILALLFSSAVFAAAWNAPSNVRIVQKNNTDNVRVFGTITAALNSITNASGTNPYVVKVMPGIYSSETVTMKPYVDVVGSGPENTIITASNNNIDGSTCTVGTVVMANNSAIRNIKIVNTAPALGGDYITVAALVFNNVKAKAEGISVLTGSDTVAGGQNNGICTFGPSAHAILNNVDVETHNYGGQSNPIEFMGGKVTLMNSKLAGFNAGEGSSVDVINNNYYDPENPGTVTVINSTLEGTCQSCGLQGITADGGAFVTSISNSTIDLHSSLNIAVLATQFDISMENVKIISDGPTWYNVDPSKVKIANSLLPGDRTALVGAKLVNNHDENYDPIANQ